jgi:xanthine dehydrogenase YagR molybdenum-binding subunit
MADVATRAIGAPVRRIEGREKVTGAARYAVEHDPGEVAYGWIVQAEVARGAISGIHDADARAHPGVLHVLWHGNAPHLERVADAELAVFQEPRVSYRGQIVAAVVADSPEAAREAARLVRMRVHEEAHDVELRADHPHLYAPEKVNPAFPTDTNKGDVEAALEKAAVTIDHTYSTPAHHNNPMEPHATLARWDGDRLTVYDSNQGAAAHRGPLAEVFGLEPDRVRVIAEHVGGGFGSKGTPRPQMVVAAMLARVSGRPVKLPITRQQMFAFTGYRTPTIQRLRLGATGHGEITAIDHQVFEQTSQIREFAEQTATCTRVMYGTDNLRTSHRLVKLDVPTPSWMRAPGECPGMYALESAIDELALAVGIDPVELRIRNDADAEPDSGKPFSSRNLVACLRQGADRFGWADRDPRQRSRDGRWLVGSGVAASTYPAYQRDAEAVARVQPDGSFRVGIAAADIGTGARTALTQIAADALGVPVERVRMDIGDSALPRAGVAGGSMGTSSWGAAVAKACEELLAAMERGETEAHANTKQEVEAKKDLARHAFGAQFAEVRVDGETGEIRVSRLLGVFAAGRIINPVTARSQFIGGMTMGMGMALLEGSVMDRRFGDYLNHDLAQYHVAANADVPAIEVEWIEESDPELNRIGTKGIGEIGIVGTAAAIANAVHHATGFRFRDLPIHLDGLVGVGTQA